MRGYNLPSRQLVGQADNAMTQMGRVPRSIFHNTWNRKTAFNVGILVPIICQEMLPGDHVKYDVSIYARMATLVQPLMDQQRVDTHFFFVPNRLVWGNWKRFMGEKDNPGDTIGYTIPQCILPSGGVSVNSVADHLGIPTLGQVEALTDTVNSLPFRMVALIWNEWFRDENLQNSANCPTGNGPDTYNTDFQNNYQRNKSQDYFTSCLPQPQNTSTGTGVTASGALVPLQGVAPVTGIGMINQTFQTGPSATVYQANNASTQYAFYKGPIDATGTNNQILIAGTGTTGYPTIYAALDGVPGFSISNLRQAWAIQQLLELDNRAGTRYIEIIFAQFGVRVPDYRLQRSEYIGGGQSPLNITAIAQTSATSTTPLATLGGTGTVAGQHQASYACQEHGYVIAFLSVKSEISYQQGLHKHWKRSTRYNYYTPATAELGDQGVNMSEIYYRQNPANDNLTFGFQERWQEYRTCYNEVTGLMRSTAAGTIDNWHMAQRFLTAPTLDTTFIVDSPPIQRVLAAGAAADKQQYVADINFRRTITRAIPTFGIPATLGRF